MGDILERRVMEIILYNNKSENNQINKVLSNSTTITGTLRDETDYITPSILIATDPTNFNYIYIENFKRYYFINRTETIRTGLWRISCNVDVLESFKDEILSLEVIIDKQETVGNQFKDDGSIVMENRRFNKTYNFSGGFNESGELILITAGANYVLS